MAVSHTNRKGEVYYLHQGQTRSGKSRYYFSRKQEGDLAEAVPEGYEVYEKPSAQVYLRKAVASRVTPQEVEAVKEGLRRAGQRYFLVEREEGAIVVHTPSQSESELTRTAKELAGGLFQHRVAGWIDESLRTGNYTAMMRFVLADEARRRYLAQRWCFKGSIDGWIHLSAPPAPLADLVARYGRHLDKESFFELM